MRDFYSYNCHPAVLRKHLPAHLWPQSANEKELDEALTLIQFAAAAGLKLDRAPANLRGNSRPDLDCHISGERMLFEVSEIVDESLAEASSTQNAGFCSYPAHPALEKILRKKLGKRYVMTDRLPLHLLLYYNDHRPWGPFAFLLGWEAELAQIGREEPIRSDLGF